MASTNDLEFKLIIGARRVRVMVYEDGVMKYPREPHSPSSTLPGGSNYAEANYKGRIKERRDSVASLIYNNFAPPDASIIALTFDPKLAKDATNLDYAHSEFKKFIQRMNYYFDNFKYVAVFNRQGNGNWHYHVISNINCSCTSKEINSIWGQGRTWVNFIETDRQLCQQVNYCLKNMQEASKEDLRKEKGYLCSKGLQREIIFKSWEESELAERCNQLFDEIRNAPHKLLYQTKFERGVKRAVNDINSGLTEYQKIGGENAREVIDDCCRKGYEPWETVYYYLESSKRFPELFHPLPAATKKKKDIFGK